MLPNGRREPLDERPNGLPLPDARSFDDDPVIDPFQRAASFCCSGLDSLTRSGKPHKGFSPFGRKTYIAVRNTHLD